MISSQILQNTLDGIKAISKIDLCVLDLEGKSHASTFSLSKDYSGTVKKFAASEAESQTMQDEVLFSLSDEEQLEYVLVVKGTAENVYTVGRLAAFQIQGLMVAYKEKFDKDNFIKNLLLDNMLLVDIYSKTKKLHIDIEARRAVFIIEANHGKENVALESLKTFFGKNTSDFITAVDEKNLILAKELKAQESYPELNKTAKSIVEHFKNNEGMDVHVAYGTIVGDIKEVSKSYKEAKMALDVGKIFFEEKKIMAYNNLGIGRLIFQLPMPLCKMFIKEIFDGKTPDDFDEETIVTINKFFENNLNVSETARQLYIHRNTLVYRLDKLQRSTGLDLRIFEDAITFKIALMVVKYMKYIENIEY